MRFFYCLIVALIVPVSSAFGATDMPGACDAKVNNHPAINTFLNSGSVKEEIEREIARGWSPGCINLVLVGEQCGAAYCQSEFLVGRRLLGHGAAVRTKTLFARAWVTSFGAKPEPPPSLIVIAAKSATIIQDASEFRCPTGRGAETTAGIIKCRKRVLDRKAATLANLVQRARRQMTKERGGHPLDPGWSKKRFAALGKSQAVWQQYSRTTCDAVYREHFPGSIANVYRLDCLIKQTQLRHEQLLDTYFSDER